MFNVRLAGGHLYVKQLLTWLSLVVPLMASFVLSVFPLDVFDKIWDLIETVSEGFRTYSNNCTSGQKFWMVQFCVAVHKILYSTHNEILLFCVPFFQRIFSQNLF